MADKVLAGSPPGPDAASMPPGTIWMQILQREADVTGKTIKVNVWCTNMCRHIGAQFGGPEQDMPGGPFLVEVFPTAWEYPPSGGSPGLVLTNDIIVNTPNFYNIEAQCSDLRAKLSCQIGAIGEDQVGPYYSESAMRDNTYEGRQELMKQEIRDMARPTGNIGSGTKLKRTQGKTTQR
jgi:hypothetical protein